MPLSTLRRWLGLSGQDSAESRRFDNYQIVRIIHDGEKAAVYLARSPREEGLFAIKAYKPEYNRTARRMRKRYHLRSEGEIGMMLNAPHGSADYPIVRTILFGHEFDDPSRCQYIIQEYVEGLNLKLMIGCGHPLLAEKRYDIARAVGRALATIHDRGMLHRDVCSDNVLVPPDGRAKLIDLGFVAPAGMAFPEKSGTPSYMAPEQFQAKPLRPAADIYSFGVVMFEMFTGRLPFTTPFNSSNPDLMMRRTSELMKQHLHARPPHPCEIATGIPEEMGALILRCLEKAPEKRPPTMAALLAEMGQIALKDRASAPEAPAT